MHKVMGGALMAGLVTALLSSGVPAGDDDRKVFGWVEKATIEETWGPEVKVKLDSGALTSSMQAEHIEEFQRDGEDWVRFVVEVEDESTEEVVSRTFERPVFRKLILTGAGGQDRRPAVLMTMCIGDTRYEEQFSLEDRSDMNYPVLLGRRTIQELGLLDVTRTFEHDPGCDEDSPLQSHYEKELDDDIGI
ncbi:RimK/LysX family protein [Halomonas sp. 18H]|uniref:retropepsin-like aspartic peptidase RloA3 n=1 Tax=Halomonas almeriensis TaxID=308163 RepID=UPI00222EF289|nr:MULTISPECIES: RimK/LysX family protein [Halomonas]MCW4151498.1 RimK/LysX family protein [Halomonas sp. 18H]MDN3552640.1 RimK/LysX family protein [Halomonas almeriensis]